MAGRKLTATAQGGSRAISTAQRVATVGGLGALPLAPGTAGSLVGAALSVPLLGAGWPLQLGATLVLAAVAVRVAGRAAEELDQPDPPQVIIDEIAYVPFSEKGA